ncbi:MAG TPA: hypothetical protein VIN39_07950 [Candidatus Dormibacteraeota bacterium]|jgi:hypothetical protein
MITLVTTFITEKIVAIITVSLVAVAVVPTTLVLTTDHGTAVVLQQQEDQQQVVLIAAVKKAGDGLIVKLQNAETSCNSQVTQVVTASKVAPGKVQSQLAQAKTQLHGSVAPFIAQIQKDEDHFAHLAVITPEDEEDELGQIQLIGITSLGGTGTTGVVTVTCGTVVIEIQQIIQVIVIQERVGIVHRQEGDD